MALPLQRINSDVLGNDRGIQHTASNRHIIVVSSNFLKYENNK